LKKKNLQSSDFWVSTLLAQFCLTDLWISWKYLPISHLEQWKTMTRNKVIVWSKTSFQKSWWCFSYAIFSLLDLSKCHFCFLKCCPTSLYTLSFLHQLHFYPHTSKPDSFTSPFFLESIMNYSSEPVQSFKNLVLLNCLFITVISLI
jgi:hypothetical protein